MPVQRLQETVGPVAFVKRTDVGSRFKSSLFEAPGVVQSFRIAVNLNGQPERLARTVDPAGRSGAGQGEG
ncbi:hypothetical protein [Streptomyces sp. NBC_00356]|uniref:hypothetical protein n=1 Tax=Streptomyces sp. NBC_00356 TaxID=2975724 RepID=UPI002E269D6F